ncbi:hypothetical protein N22_035 [Idiomarinaceae phage 1N2-2]|uniref:hypothetical protein n=1 Tax=Idiomarinaceae phage 1N2-2 TaxID=1536592 RepID=UPI0004F8618A|nr:hypothetical protein N22_035 [Idiomarinaceae phage 1N2-2]AIM40737.1 hypothetical protein N22_035 [Idiomarinaceae phage 1N2-2]
MSYIKGNGDFDPPADPNAWREAEVERIMKDPVALEDLLSDDVISAADILIPVCVDIAVCKRGDEHKHYARLYAKIEDYVEREVATWKR